MSGGKVPADSTKVGSASVLGDIPAETLVSKTSINKYDPF